MEAVSAAAGAVAAAAAGALAAAAAAAVAAVGVAAAAMGAAALAPVAVPPLVWQRQWQYPAGWRHDLAWKSGRGEVSEKGRHAKWEGRVTCKRMSRVAYLCYQLAISHE